MSDRLAAAQAALNGGRRDEAIGHMIAAVGDDPARPVQVYRTLTVHLYQAGRYDEGAAFGAKGLERFPRDFDLLNVRGVNLRKLKRLSEALAALELATRVAPKNLGGLQNYGNVLLDLNEGAKAEGVFSRLVRIDPRNGEYQRQLGRALHKQNKLEPALVRFRQAVTVQPGLIDAWLDMVGILGEEHRTADAEAQLDRAIAANPGNARLLEGKTMVLRRTGQVARAEAFAREVLAAQPDAAWVHHQLGIMVSEQDRAAGNVLLRRAIALDPGRIEYVTALIESLERTRSGDEGGHIEEGYQLAKTILHRSAEFTESVTKILCEIMIRVCDFDGLDQVGDFRTLGRGWAGSGRHTALLKQLARVRTDEDRRELLEQHRIWGRGVEVPASRRPIKRPPPRAPGGKVRLGFMSSDLRQHPVGYFALPLFDHVDHERFEVFVYSFYTGQEDAAQRHITERVTAYRWWPDISVAGAAEKIAEDQLDMLIELGGSTHMNKLEVMAYKPAPVQASWLGYPHSAGLEAIDYLVCDPITVPSERELLVEKPLMMPKSWIALGSRFFSNTVEIKEAPELRNGFITYGTANNPHKYTREVLQTWARVVAATPGSKFAFIRPEGSGESFRANILRQFAAEGVSADRVIFHVIRGAHMPFYNEVDITLDPFPLTGGTTTAETLWMGVPLISLIGPAFYERLSASIMTNSGIGDLAVNTLDDYLAAAVALAGNRERRLELRGSLRDRMRNGPLGQTDQFARDFYDMIYRTVRPAG
jgi:predicted O-linked N-acetylglucosamine transferase (SPINDLY family)